MCPQFPLFPYLLRLLALLLATGILNLAVQGGDFRLEFLGPFLQPGLRSGVAPVSFLDQGDGLIEGEALRVMALLAQKGVKGLGRGNDGCLDGTDPCPFDVSGRRCLKRIKLEPLEAQIDGSPGCGVQNNLGRLVPSGCRCPFFHGTDKIECYGIVYLYNTSKPPIYGRDDNGMYPFQVFCSWASQI